MGLFITYLSSSIPSSNAWKNGPTANEFSTDPYNPKYGTHDWIAQHALDLLDDSEKQYLLDNLAIYLYGTELPDKPSGPNAINDGTLRHVYFNESGTVMDDSAAERSMQEFLTAEQYFENGDLVNGMMHLGVMTHYIANLSAFGNVMNTTYWGEPVNHTKYIEYVNSKMTSYDSEFNSYLTPLDALGVGNAKDAALLVAKNTTFDYHGYRNCTWMDSHYGWSNNFFKDRCGESLNFAVNIISNVLHIFYKSNLSTPSPPQNLVVDSVSGFAVNLSWSANTEKYLAGYSIYINKTGSNTIFEPEPIASITSGTNYTIMNLRNETTYYFKLRAYSQVGKESTDSNIVPANTSDITSPPIPRLRSISAFTKNPKLNVTGFSDEPGSLIEVYLNNDFSAPAGANYSETGLLGYFRIEITLTDGLNNITARAIDSSSNPSDFAPYQLIILDAIPPLADAGGNIEVSKRDSPVLIQFNGSNSTDNQGVITNYTWTIDLKSELITLYGVSPTYLFNKSGEFQVSLNITDQTNNWAIDYLWVNITQLDYQPPYIVNYYPSPGATNQSINITIKAIFNEPLNVSSINIKLYSNVEGDLQIPRPAYDPMKRLLTLKPFGNLTHDRTYMVSITATDLTGNPLMGSRWNFSTLPRPTDFDGDQIPDIWEWQFGLDANESDSLEDPDNDHLTNFDEYNNGRNSTDPTKQDTDGDGMTDYFERLYSLNPLDINDRDQDPDGDGKTNYEEYLGSDGEPGNFDWTDPNTVETSKSSNDQSEDDYTWVMILVIIIIIIIIFLIFLLRRIQYKQTHDIVKDDDGYLKTKDADELGVGGNIFFEGPSEYVLGGKKVIPRYQGSNDAAKSETSYTKDQALDDRPTPAEILEKAKREEKKCPKCGAGLPQDTTYCFECGLTLNEK